MCRGVTRGLAGKKFSGSPKRRGVKRDKKDKRVSKIKNPIASLTV